MPYATAFHQKLKKPSLLSLHFRLADLQKGKDEIRQKYTTVRTMPQSYGYGGAEQSQSCASVKCPEYPCCTRIN